MNLTYQEDIPTEKPQFDYLLIAEALMPLLLNPGKYATVIGIHGPWGAGKTTLMNALREKLEKELEATESIFITFNPWKFQDHQSLWRALILHVVAEVRRIPEEKEGGELEKKLKELEESLYQAFSVEEKGAWAINWRSLVVEIIGLCLSLVKLDFVAQAVKSSTGMFARLFTWRSSGDDKGQSSPIIDYTRVDKIASVLERKTIERRVQQVQSVEQFLGKFRDLLEIFLKNNRRIFVFIDDLDRCLPESALEIFEAIKLFLDAPGSAYIVALDREIIRKGLAVKYGRRGEAAGGQTLVDPDEYIEKTISLSFDLPRLSNVDAFHIIDQFPLPKKLSAKQKHLIIRNLGTNPRRVKRFMNTLSIQLHLAQVANGADLEIDKGLLGEEAPEHFAYFLKLLLIGYRYSGIFSLGLQEPELFARLQTIGNKYEAARVTSIFDARAQRKQTLQQEVPLIVGLQDIEDFWRLLNEQPDFLLDKHTLRNLCNWFRYRPSLSDSQEVAGQEQ